MSFISDIIKDINKAKELTDAEKQELVGIAQSAWDSEQE